MKTERIACGMANAYLLHGDGGSILIDTGAEKYREKVAKACQNAGVRLILLTHGHFDHCMAAQELAAHYGISIYVHEDEKETMENPAYNCCGMIGKNLSFQADKYFHGEKDRLSAAGFDIDVLHTPGHTVGGACFYVKSEGILFSGDTLFCESVGRTDFPKGSMSQLVRSIHEKLMPLPDSTKVLPGHGEWTTIGKERQYNPFL